MNTLYEYNQRHIGTDEVVNRVNVLFRGRADLLDLFCQWLPHLTRSRVEARIVPLSDEDDSEVEE